MSGPDLLPIVACGEPILRQPTEPVDVADLGTPELLRLIAQMRATMEAAPGVGLAAPQVGVPLQLAVLQDGPAQWGSASDDERAARERRTLPFTVLVNPALEPLGGDDLVSFYEGCLSVPGLTGVVARHRAVRVRALDEHGQPVETVFSGWPARIVQHEVDHLGGHLYVDRVETRSLSTLDTFAQRWAGRPPSAAAEALGFTLSPGDGAT
ncbi:MAG TPA: peptide deformylase [Acidimicrobiales bacterium]